MVVGFDDEVAVGPGVGPPAEFFERDHGFVWRRVRHVEEEAVIVSGLFRELVQPCFSTLCELRQNRLVVEARSYFEFAI